MAKKKGRRHVRRVSSKKRRHKPRAKIHQKAPARRRARIVSRPLPGDRSRHRRKVSRRHVARKNPAQEFLVEAYVPKGRKFFFFQGDNRLTSKRDDAARFKDRSAAEKTARFVRSRAPRGVDWVRVCPA